MYIDPKLKNLVDYRFSRDKAGNDIAQVRFRHNENAHYQNIAVLYVPRYQDRIEDCQSFIYSVVRAYIKMMKA